MTTATATQATHTRDPKQQQVLKALIDTRSYFYLNCSDCRLKIKSFDNFRSLLLAVSATCFFGTALITAAALLPFLGLVEFVDPLDLLICFSLSAGLSLLLSQQESYFDVDLSSGSIERILRIGHWRYCEFRFATSDLTAIVLRTVLVNPGRGFHIEYHTFGRFEDCREILLIGGADTLAQPELANTASRNLARLFNVPYHIVTATH